VPRLQAKRFDQPDEVRTLPKVHVDIVTLDETSVGLARWEPGWRWSTDLGPLTGTASCQVHHLGYAISGTLHVELEDGGTLDIHGDSVFEIPAGHDAWVVGSEPFVTLEWTSVDAVGVDPDGPGERLLATILFTDIVGSTAKAVELGDARWRELLEQHHATVRRLLLRHRGTELDTAGDGFFASFDGPARGIRCARAITESVRDLGIEVRAGLHTGECERMNSKVGGIAVHIGARVAAEAGPGEVVVSSTVKDLVAGSGIAFHDRGAAELKGVPGEWRLFAVESG